LVGSLICLECKIVGTARKELTIDATRMALLISPFRL
jgi:hypothetical protein